MEAKTKRNKRAARLKRVTRGGMAYTSWRDGRWWLGFLHEFPKFWTQGRNLADLEAHLLGLREDLTDKDFFKHAKANFHGH